MDVPPSELVTFYKAGEDTLVLVQTGFGPAAVELWGVRGDKAEKVYPSSSHHGNWLECIKSGKPTICTAETGQRSATICHLGNIGYRLGKKLKYRRSEQNILRFEIV